MLTLGIVRSRDGNRETIEAKRPVTRLSSTILFFFLFLFLPVLSFYIIGLFFMQLPLMVVDETLLGLLNLLPSD